MAKILGSQQTVDIDITGGTTYASLICLRTSSVNITMDATTEQTNCGSFTSPSEPSASVDFDAICETTQTASQISYDDLLTAMVNKTQINVRVQNPVVSGSSAGAAYYHQFLGYVTDLTLNQATSEFVNFSGTISSSGTIDITA